MRGSRPRVYLAGPITALEYQGASSWRDYATKALAPGIVAVSPLRGIPRGASVDFDTGPHTGAHEATIRDEWDVRTCDAVLMNLKDAERVSIGSMIEAGLARAFRTPLIVVGGERHDHPMLKEVAGWWLPDLDDAIDTLRVLFARGA
jgi:nucleoside 2-deoxyribosyltransferase